MLMSQDVMIPTAIFWEPCRAMNSSTNKWFLKVYDCFCHCTQNVPSDFQNPETKLKGIAILLILQIFSLFPHKTMKKGNIHLYHFKLSILHTHFLGSKIKGIDICELFWTWLLQYSRQRKGGAEYTRGCRCD